MIYGCVIQIGEVMASFPAAYLMQQTTSSLLYWALDDREKERERKKETKM